MLYNIIIFMKNKLAKIKTTFDEDGNIDHEEYLSTQKAVYDRQINFAIRVDAITDQQFILKPLQIGFLNSTALKDDQKFKDIKKIMADYNKSILQRGGGAVNGGHLKKVVMESMLKFMRLMMLAPDTGTKKVILDIAHHWFIKHLDPKSTRKSTNELLAEIKQIIIQKKLLPIDLVNKQLIINKVNEQLRPYKLKARTMYNQLDDPKLQLNNYNTHKLQFMTQSNKDNTGVKNDKKWVDTLKFPKIQPYMYAIEEPELEIKNQPDQPKPNLDSTQQQPPPVDGQQPPLLDAEGKPIPPQNPVQNAEQGADLDFGAPGEGDPEPQQQQEVIEDKKKGKLDPLLKVFILERIRKQKRQQAICTKVRQKSMNKYNSTYDEDLLSGDHLRQWAKTRARIKTQVSRRNQSMRGGDRIARGKQGDQTLSFIENDIDRIKAQSTIDQYKKVITAVGIPPDKLNTEHGLSLFDRRRVKTQASHKPFSSILFDHSKKAEQTSALTEISDIKQKFSKYKIYAPMDTLIKGLAPPDKQHGEDQDKIIWPNSQLLSNPFMKVAKKKKKKKKK